MIQRLLAALLAVALCGRALAIDQPVRIVDGAGGVNSANVTPAGHLLCDVSGGGGGGGTAMTDETAFTAGTDAFTPAGGVFNDSMASPSSGQGAVCRITSARGLHVNLRNASGAEVGTNSSPLRVDPTGTTTQPVSGTVTANQGGAPWSVTVSGTPTVDVTDRSARVVGRVFMRNPGDTANMGDATTPVRVDPTGTTTQPVSGTVTANQGGAPWSVSGTVTANQGGAPWSVSQSGSPWGVSGTVTANQGGAPWSGIYPDVTAVSTALSSLNAALTVNLQGQAAVTFVATASTATNTVVFEVSADSGTSWEQVQAFTWALGLFVQVSSVAGGSSVPNQYTIPTAGFNAARARMSAFTSGSQTYSARATVAVPGVAIVGGTTSVTQVTSPWVVNASQWGGTNVSNGGAAGSVAIGGLNANNAAITQNPDLIGVEAQSGQPTAATTGNVRRLVGSLDGAVYVRPGGPVPWACSLDALGATLTQCQAAPGAGLKLYLTDVVIMGATTTGGQALIRYGTGAACVTGTTSLFPSAATVVRIPYQTSTVLPTVIQFQTPLSAAANNAICVICVATNTCTVQLSGYTAP